MALLGAGGPLVRPGTFVGMSEPSGAFVELPVDPASKTHVEWTVAPCIAEALFADRDRSYRASRDHFLHQFTSEVISSEAAGRFCRRVFSHPSSQIASGL